MLSNEILDTTVFKEPSLVRMKEQYQRILESLTPRQKKMLDWIWEYRKSSDSWPHCHRLLLHFSPKAQKEAKNEIEAMTGNLVHERDGSRGMEYSLSFLGILSVPSVDTVKFLNLFDFIRGRIDASLNETQITFGYLSSSYKFTNKDLEDIKAICHHGWFLVSGVAWTDSHLMIRSDSELADLVDCENAAAYVLAKALDSFDLDIPVNKQDRTKYISNFEYVQSSEWKGLTSEVEAFRNNLFAKCLRKANLLSYCLFGLLGIIAATLVSIPILINNVPLFLRWAAILITVLLMVLSFLSRHSIGDRRGRFADKIAERSYNKRWQGITHCSYGNNNDNS